VTFDELADLHARALQVPRPWSSGEIAALLSHPTVYLVEQTHGFALGRVVADEVELLTIAVDPEWHRKGIGGRLLTAFETKAQDQRAKVAFLEVASGNFAARALYTAAGYSETGRRPGYYVDGSGQRSDALILSRSLAE
jgi:ribosomal-protein-alanine N-acetyltransferase